MSDFVALGSAVLAFVDSNTTTPVYYGLVPQGSAYPAVTVNRHDARDEYTFTSSGVSVDYLIKAISNRELPNQAATIYDALHALINNKHLTISGFTALRFQRQTTVEYQDNGYWHLGGIYRMDAQKG